MARLFDDAVPHYISVGSAVLTGVPITMACWFNSDDGAAFQTLMCIADTAGTEHYFLLTAEGSGAGGPVGARTGAGVASGNALTTGNYTVGTWHHAAGVWTAVDSRSALIDAGNKGSEASSATPAGVDTTAIGAAIRSTQALGTSGRIAEAAIWNIALTDAEVAILAAGYSPLLVHPQNLILYAPLVREILDVVGGVALANTGSTVGDHPRVLYPATQSLVAPPTAVVAAIASQRLKIGHGR